MAEQTRCDLFGHKFGLWKEGGQSYMRCDYCPATRHVTADDLKPEIPDFDDRPRRPMPTFDYDDMEDWWGFGG